MPASREFFSDLQLAQRLERAEALGGARFVEARAKFSPESGAQWIEVAGAYAMYDGPASFVTQTFGLGLFQPATPAVLDGLERFFRERGAPVFHEVSPLAGLPTASLLHDRGYRPVEFTSVLYRPIQPGTGLGVAGSERIQVRPIREGEEDLWTRIAAEGWGETVEASDFMRDAGPICARRQDGLAFLAELDGEPIAAGALCLGSEVALLAGACTIPKARHQGAQLALLDARLRYAAGQGCDLAMMCAAPGSSSQRNAERHGFRIAYTRLKWGLGDGTP
jgi:hypothetical protein